MRSALIIGGGIAGPAAAIALRQAGFDATVCEAYPAGADEVGSWLTLQANGIDALAAIGAHSLVASIGFATRTMRFVNGNGRVLGTISNGNPLPDGTPSQMVPRAALYRALRDEAEARGAHVHYNARLIDARLAPGGGVQATFADGEVRSADVLIGADGIRSVVRRIIDPAAPEARYVPVLNLGDKIPDFPLSLLGRPTDEFQMIFGKRCFFGITATPDGGAVWFANPPEPQEPPAGQLQRVSSAAWRSRLARLFEDDNGPVADVARRAIQSAPEPLLAWPTYDLPTVPKWHRGAIAIIGDAAHATAPSAGQGAALALEDAVVIAQCLRDSPDAETAFTAFEEIRRDRVEKTATHGNRGSTSKAVGPFGRIIRDAILPIIFRHLSSNNGAATQWITNHHIDWASTPIPLAPSLPE
ncbi:FAD-dependent monooxygenase [Paenarthrobacter sp. PH39-S1]|uniref:FAD-dependent monooxygenase n=1 Tax=Paenarthrobacter sp. PH39-S1 TaxID=3046204 RepID=UPI0024BBAF33|nr:FAD-dependent monooxygenase [Paenarthrobacter sp. PH39-S1]MDJ0356615.1 FAD-dependent monooxygenase [Paenarthrobacter sp. PH39-S1]